MSQVLILYVNRGVINHHFYNVFEVYNYFYFYLLLLFFCWNLFIFECSETLLEE